MIWRPILIKVFIYFTLILISFSIFCKKEPSKEAVKEAVSLVGAEIDIQRIENLLGIKFKVLKTETVGYIPLNKFYWVCFEEKTTYQKVEELAHEIVRETIAKKPKTFHSFTIHFFWKDEMAGIPENSKSFARANFLPEGSWVKVGRVPLDDYKSYTLTCKFFE